MKRRHHVQRGGLTVRGGPTVREDQQCGRTNSAGGHLPTGAGGTPTYGCGRAYTTRVQEAYTTRVQEGGIPTMVQEGGIPTIVPGRLCTYTPPGYIYTPTTPWVHHHGLMLTPGLVTVRTDAALRREEALGSNRRLIRD